MNNLTQRANIRLRVPSTTNRPISELAMDLASKGMEDNATNLRALGAHPAAAQAWWEYRVEQPTSAVSIAMERIRKENQ